jgi:hypothetical protein
MRRAAAENVVIACESLWTSVISIKEAEVSQLVVHTHPKQKILNDR